VQQVSGIPTPVAAVPIYLLQRVPQPKLQVVVVVVVVAVVVVVVVLIVVVVVVVVFVAFCRALIAFNISFY